MRVDKRFRMTDDECAHKTKGCFFEAFDAILGCKGSPFAAGNCRAANSGEGGFVP